MLNANIPIFTAGQIEADVRRAWSELARRHCSSRSPAATLQGVRLAYENVTASRERLGDLQTQVQAAREALEQAEGSYRVGLATNLERLTAQSDLLSAELQLTSERFDQALLRAGPDPLHWPPGKWWHAAARQRDLFGGERATPGTGNTAGGAGFRTSNFIGNTSGNTTGFSQ